VLSLIPVAPRSIGDYNAVVGADTVADLRARAEPFRGARVLHISSTAFGGGVAELLYTHVPLMRDLGLDVEWRLLEGDEAFFTVTKAMHNGLQGAEVPFTEQMRERYLEANQINAAGLEQTYDFVIVHDPQPAAIRSFLNGDHHVGKRWIWRCHIDLTQPLELVWDFLSEFVGDYDACIFTMRDFVPAAFSPRKLALITPSIDPLSLKNIPLDHEIVSAVTARYGVDDHRPLMLQVSRFDPWKDPLGVIDAFRIARERVDGLQLVMIASMASDDPEGWHYYSRTEEHRAGDPDISLLSNLQEVGALDVNAFQYAANVIVQKSLREGFGLTVTEGMWKRKAVIAGDVGGIRLQIDDAVTGYLVDSVEACAERVVQVLEDTERAAAMGVAARSIVRERYLTTRDLAEYLDLFRDLA